MYSVTPPVPSMYKTAKPTSHRQAELYGPKSSALMHQYNAGDHLSSCGASTSSGSEYDQPSLRDLPRIRVPEIREHLPSPYPHITRIITFGVVDGGRWVTAVPLIGNGDELQGRRLPIIEFQSKNTFWVKIQWSGYDPKYLNLMDIASQGVVTKKLLFLRIKQAYLDYFEDIKKQLASASAPDHYRRIPREERIAPGGMEFGRLCLGYIGMNEDGVWTAGPGMVASPSVY